MERENFRSQTPDNPGAANSKQDNINMLLNALSSKDWVKRVNGRKALIKLGPAAVNPVIGVINSKNQTVRWEAVKVLQQIGDPSSVDALVNALRDNMFDVRWIAAEALINIGDASIKPLLRATINFPDSDEIREGAHHVFHDMHSPKYADILKPVIAILEDPTLTLDIPLAAKKALDAIK